MKRILSGLVQIKGESKKIKFSLTKGKASVRGILSGLVQIKGESKNGKNETK